MACEMYKGIYIRVTEKIQHDLFVEDLVTGWELEEVDRFMGSKNYENFKCSGTMTQIFEKGGLHVKAMQRDGELEGEELELFGGAVLGVGWRSEEDRPNC